MKIVTIVGARSQFRLRFTVNLWLPFSKIINSKRKLQPNELINPLIAVWFFALFNSFVSMDISGNYLLWLSGGIVYYYNQVSKLVLREVQK